ncbi:MAG: hypothetical protein ACT4OJ_02145 [Bacteroidota bacterium]
MNKILFCVISLTLIVAACTKKALPPEAYDVRPVDKKTAAEKPATDASKPAEEKAETTAQPPPKDPAAPNKPSEEETGKAVYASKCTKCHAAKNVGNYSFNQWELILKKMVPNAKLSADEENQVVAYIRAHSK